MGGVAIDVEQKVQVGGGHTQRKNICLWWIRRKLILENGRNVRSSDKEVSDFLTELTIAGDETKSEFTRSF